jgi:uncharacterized membrane protein
MRLRERALTSAGPALLPAANDPKEARMRYARTAAIAALVLAAIVAANLIVNRYGPSVTPYVAFGLIGFDIVGRDRLHLDLAGPTRWTAIGGLIALGSILTYALNAGAGPIALGSVCAFAAAMVVDTLVFQAAGGLDAHRRVNVSNAAAAAVDTVVFFAIAFGLGAIPFVLLFAQFTAKVAGGALWALLVVREAEDVEDLYAPDAAVLPRDA